MPSALSQGVQALAAEAQTAQHRIASLLCTTRLLHSGWLSDATGANVLLKLENEQATGSFKVRGATNKVLSLTEEQLAGGIVTSSTGNHALAVLHACRVLESSRPGQPSLQPSIYAPSTLVPGKAQRLQQLGAQVISCGRDCIHAEQQASRAAQQQGGIYISPYNDLQVAGGQGTIAIELLLQLSCPLDFIFVPVGGGGLISGIAAVLKSRSPGTRIVGCQPVNSAVMMQSVAAGRVLELESKDTLSDGTAGGVETDSITFQPCCELVDDWLTVDEQGIAAAMYAAQRHHGLRLEGSAGVALAAVLQHRQHLAGRTAVAICCGGNVSDEVLAAVQRMAEQPATD